MREVKQQPAITAVEMKQKHPEVLQTVAILTIHHRSQKDLALPSLLAAMKPLLTEATRKKKAAAHESHEKIRSTFARSTRTGQRINGKKKKSV